MALPVTAQDEILKRIQSLDRVEGDLRRKAGKLVAEAGRVEAQAEAAAVLRRQYEYAFQQLGGEFPRPSTAVEVPVKQGGRLIAQLG